MCKYLASPSFLKACYFSSMLSLTECQLYFIRASLDPFKQYIFIIIFNKYIFLVKMKKNYDSFCKGGAKMHYFCKMFLQS